MWEHEYRADRHWHSVIPRRSSIVMPSGGPPASPPFHCWSDRSGPAWGHGVAGQPVRDEALLSQIATCSHTAEWVRSVAEQIDLPAAAVHCLAQRAERDPDELLAAWRAKTPADRERFWNTLAPNVDDDLLRAVATLAVGRGSRSAVAASLSDLGERIVPMIARLAPSANWPSVLFVAGSADDFSSVGRVAVTMGHARAGLANCGRGTRRSVGRIPAPPLRSREPKHS